MSGRIGKYTYKNESVLKEFLGSLFRALGSRKADKVTKKLSKDPEMKKLRVSDEDTHPNTEGHKVIAELLYSGIMQNE